MCIKKLLQMFSSLLIATLLGAAFIAPAYALDGKTYAGSSCVRWSGPTPVYSWGRIGNPSTTTDLYLDCPVVKDAIGNNFDSNWMRVVDINSADSVRCRLYSVYRSGGTIWYWAGATLSTGNAYFGSNEVQISSGANVGANSVSHSYFSCKIPNQQIGRSYISSVHAVEF